MSSVAFVGFWRRVGAFLIDLAVLALMGTTLGVLFHEQLVSLGGWGRLLGFLMAVGYFGVLQSSCGPGRTAGKFLLGAKVVGVSGASPTVGTSVLRASLLCLPWFLNGAAFPAGGVGPWLVVSLLVTTVVLGLGPALLFLVAANVPDRQSLHDLVARTFVVRVGRETAASGNVGMDEGGPAVAAGSTHPAVIASRPRPRLVGLALGWVGLVVAGSLMWTFVLPKPSLFVRLGPPMQALVELPGVWNASIQEGVTHSGGSSRRFLSANIFVRSPSESVPALVREAAEVLLAIPQETPLDFIQVQVARGFDLGIAKSWVSERVVRSPQEWRAELEGAELQPGELSPASGAEKL